MSEKNLKELLQNWRDWSKTADKSNDGWQSYWDYWTELMDSVKSKMKKKYFTDDEIENIDFCWNISEEDENLLDFVKENIFEYWKILKILVNSDYSNTRWQIYSALGFCGYKSKKLLFQGLEDGDCYCRLKAFLSILKVGLNEDEWSSLVKKMVNDNNSVILFYSDKIKKELEKPSLIRNLEKVIYNIIDDKYKIEKY